MEAAKSSSLNPLANSFFPGKKPDEGKPIKSIAEKWVKELLERKGRKDQSVTKHEMADLVGNLITLRFNISNSADLKKINSYISSKVINADIPAFKSKVNSKLIIPQSTPKIMTKNFDAAKLPKATFLIVAFWGLYRHEQAQLPLLSLPHRPEVVTDEVWSINSSDKQLWNTCIVQNTCSCPPMFGYSIPPMFFGNVFNIRDSCSEHRIHLNHYSESAEGNEFILSSNYKYNTTEDIDLPDVFDEQVKSNNVCLLKKHFQSILDDICNILEEHAENSIVDADIDVGITEDNKLCLWDTQSEIKYYPTIPKKDLVDDGEHPLLENQSFIEEEGVSLEIKEIIGRSFSQKKMQDLNPIKEESEEVDEQDIICDPPCSIWCSSNLSKDLTSSNCIPEDSSVHIEIKVTPPEPETSAVITTDLISPDQLNSQEGHKRKFSFADITPILDLVGPRPQRFSYKRSYSVNDCDPYYYETKFGLNDSKEQAFNQISSKDMFVFLRKDPVNYFKAFKRKDSWKDSDSGFMSHWSSQEDILNEQPGEDKGYMWGLFSGEDSLWKPMPECETPDTPKTAVTHRRVNDLKRQRSVT